MGEWVGWWVRDSRLRLVGTHFNRRVSEPGMGTLETGGTFSAPYAAVVMCSTRS